MALAQLSSSYDQKAPPVSPADTMALDTDMNGISHPQDPSNPYKDAPPSLDDQSNATAPLPAQPTVNGNSHAPEPAHRGDVSREEVGAVAGVEAGVGANTADFSGSTEPPASSLLPERPTQSEEMADAPEPPPASSIPPAVEAPTSDVRDEAPPHADAPSDVSMNAPTQESELEPSQSAIPSIETGAHETRAPAAEDAMDTSADGAPAEAIAAPSQPPPEVSTPAANNITETPSAVAQEAATQEVTTQEVAAQETALPSVSTAVDHEMTDAPTVLGTRAREDDEDAEREAKRAKTDEAESSEFKVPGVPLGTPQAEEAAVPTTEAPASTTAGSARSTESDTIRVAAAGGAAAHPPAQPIQLKDTSEFWSKEPMTPDQMNGLLSKLRNTKKIKAAKAFLLPVDHVALNIPNYPEVIKNPMDLSTLENKLKANAYQSVWDFMQDFRLIVANCMAFNGAQHPISMAALEMQGYFEKFFDIHVPGAAGATAAVEGKKKKPATPTAAEPRERRKTARVVEKPPPTPTAVTSASPSQQTFALQSDGMPMIRRDSTNVDGRPKREIHRPPPRDLPYTARPKKKKFQLELKFCESVLGELVKNKHYKCSYPFLKPVDPVALNIPTYHKIIKKPIDLETIEKRLKAGEYQNAKEFKSDIELMFANCFKFNPETDDVHKMGKQFLEVFNAMWATKTDWIEQHSPPSEPQSPAAEEDDSAEEDEASEEEDTAPSTTALADIQKQIFELTQKATMLLEGANKLPSPKARGSGRGPGKKTGKGPGKKSKKGDGAGGSSKGTALVPGLKQPMKRKSKPQPVTWAHKQEISETIATLDDSNMRKAVQIIRNGCPNLQHVDDDEMELDIEQIPDDVLRELLKFCRGIRPKRASGGAVSDDDYDSPPPRSLHRTSSTGAGGAVRKTKKNKPMGKREQEESIAAIQRQLQSFQNPSASDKSDSPAKQEESSDDDESSGSESEEE